MHICKWLGMELTLFLNPQWYGEINSRHYCISPFMTFQWRDKWKQGPSNCMLITVNPSWYSQAYKGKDFLFAWQCQVPVLHIRKGEFATQIGARPIGMGRVLTVLVMWHSVDSLNWLARLCWANHPLEPAEREKKTSGHSWSLRN